MGFRSVAVYHFRNLVDAELHFEGREIFLVGENGQGKTNILETIYCLCFGASFRTRVESLLIRHGEREMSLRGLYVPDEDATSAPETSREPYERATEVQLKLSGGKKEILSNGKPIADRKELLANAPCILFAHEDIAFVTGAPEGRRWFFNQTMSLDDPLFIDHLRRYQKVLLQRNNALRSARRDLVELYDVQLVDAGLEIQRRRAQVIDLFNETFRATFREVSGLAGELSIRYRPSWGEGADAAQAARALAERSERDRELGATTSGPHRDHFTFALGGESFARTASTGQLRLISLVLRVAQACFYRERTGRRPILLLDDVLLELDLKRRGRFLGTLPEAEQVFFTFLPDEQFRSYQKESTRVYHVSEGAVRV